MFKVKNVKVKKMKWIKTCKTDKAGESRRDIFLKCIHHHGSILGGNLMCLLMSSMKNMTTL